MDPKMKHAMGAVLEGMGRAAREGKARRFMKKPVEVSVGGMTIEPTSEARREHGMADQEVDPLKQSDMSDDEMAELMGGLQR